MASGLVRSGRVAFAILLSIQGISLASFPACYEESNFYYFLLILCPIIPLLLWIYVIRKKENLRWLFAVWSVYVIGLVVLIGVIFGRTDTIEDKLNKDVFLKPNVLKLTLCLSPILLLLLLSTGVDSMTYRELIWMLSLRIALDLFDGVEMLEVILEANEFCQGISKDFEKAIIAFVCLSFVMSPFQLMEIKFDWLLDDWKIRKCTSVSRTSFQIIFVNVVFLVFRLVLFFEYSKDASIFLAKNIIIIFLGLFEICSICRCCGCDDY